MNSHIATLIKNIKPTTNQCPTGHEDCLTCSRGKEFKSKTTSTILSIKHIPDDSHLTRYLRSMCLND